VKVQGQIGLKSGAEGVARRAVTWLTFVALALAVNACLESNMVRELFLFVGPAALLVFFGVNVAVLGFLLHEAGRSILRLLRKARPTAVMHKEVPVERLDDRFVGSPTMSTAGRAGSN
jgi:hypothetical protein